MFVFDAEPVFAPVTGAQQEAFASISGRFQKKGSLSAIFALINRMNQFMVHEVKSKTIQSAFLFTVLWFCDYSIISEFKENFQLLVTQES